ncbi:glycosyltransferase [Streptomyces nigra]|uniref:glycosyltransferase n=1 Tax=Streptomyces nigra TaxID=1827580 RepID=UPI0037D564A8
MALHLYHGETDTAQHLAATPHATTAPPSAGPGDEHGNGTSAPLEQAESSDTVAGPAAAHSLGVEAAGPVSAEPGATDAPAQTSAPHAPHAAGPLSSPDNLRYSDSSAHENPPAPRARGGLNRLFSVKDKHLSIELSFGEQSKEISGREQSIIDKLAERLARQAYRNARADLPLPRIEITGYGNGSSFPSPSRSKRAHDTGWQRAAATGEALRASIDQQLKAVRGPADPLLTVSDFPIHLASAGRQAPSVGRGSEASRDGVSADDRRKAVVAVSYPYEPVVIGAEPTGSVDAVTVPRALHFVWFGGELREAARLNLEAWKARAARSDWEINIWTDAGARTANADFFQAIQTDPGIRVRPVDDSFFSELAENEEMEAAAIVRSADLFEHAINRKAYEIASDVTRYVALYRMGGVYLDVDLAPGRIELPTTPVTMRQSSIPLFAPQIRDRGEFERILHEMGETAGPDGTTGAAGSSSSSVDEQLTHAAEWQYSQGRLNNSFLVAPAGSPFFRRAITDLIDPRDPLQQMRLQAPRQNAADITGPSLLSRTLMKTVTETGPLSPGVKLADAFSNRLILVHPSQRSRWNGLGWITEESENQGSDSADGTEAGRFTDRADDITDASRAVSSIAGTGLEPARPAGRVTDEEAALGSDDEAAVVTPSEGRPDDGGEQRSEEPPTAEPTAARGGTSAPEPLTGLASPGDPTGREVRLHTPVLAEAPDGAAVRQAIAEMLGGEPRHVTMAEIAFSDQNLQNNFRRALDGGHTEWLGDSLSKDYSEITVRVTAIDGLPPGTERTGLLSGMDETADAVGRDELIVSERTRRTEKSTTAEPAAAGSGNDFAVVTPYGVIAARVAGIVNERGTTVKVSTSAEHSTTVSEPQKEVLKGTHQVAYEVTVRRRTGRGPLPFLGAASSSTSRQVTVPAELTWQSRAGGAAAQEPPASLRHQAIVHAEFTGLGEVYQAVQSRIGSFQVTDRTAREFDQWLQSVPSRADDLFAGRALRGTFRFNGAKQGTEVLIAVADAVENAESVTVPDAVVEDRHTTVAERGEEHAQTRQRGGRVTLMPGNLIAGAGPSLHQVRSKKDIAGVKDVDQQDEVSTYRGPLEKYSADVRFLVQIHQPPELRDTLRAAAGRSGRAEGAESPLRVDGKATVWMRPLEAEPGEGDTPGEATPVRGEPESGPDSGILPDGPLAEAERKARMQAEAQRVLDKAGARYRLRGEAVEGIVGPVLHRLQAKGILRPQDVSTVADEMRSFVRANARELATGADGVRFPLSSVRSGYPDVFLRGQVQVSASDYVGPLPGESSTATLASTTEHTHVRTSGKDRRAGVAFYVYSPPLFMGGDVFRAESRVRSEGQSEKTGTVRKFSGDLHRWQYHMDVTVSIGGRWGEMTPPEQWAPSSTAVDDTGALSVALEVDATAAGDALTGIATTLNSAPASDIWTTNRPSTAQRTGMLPGSYQLEALRPPPRLISTVSQMLADSGASRAREALAALFVGRRPKDFDDKHDGSLHALEVFSSTPVRMARFARTVAWRDILTLQLPNTGGMFGSRMRSARVELSGELSNPRIVARDDAHVFAADGVAARGTNTADMSGQSLTGHVSGAPVFGVTPSLNMAPNAEATYSRATEVGGKASQGTQNATSTQHTARAYLVTFDITHALATSSRRHWFDPIGMHHDSEWGKQQRWAHTEEAVAVWVPASEIHDIGQLDDVSLARMVTADAELYRHARAQQAHDDTAKPAAGSTASESAPDHDERAQPDAATHAGKQGVPAPAPPLRGRGTAELHDHEAVQTFIREIEKRLPRGVDLLRSLATTADGPRRENRLHALAGVNDRLIDGIIGPIAATNRLKAVLHDMLNGGWPVYLPALTPFGKVEQMAVIHAELGPGTTLDTLRATTGTKASSTTTMVGDDGARSRSSALELNAGPLLFAGMRGLPAGLLTGGPRYGFTADASAQLADSQSRSLERSAQTELVRSLHDLRVRVEIHPFAKPGAYSELPLRLISRLTKRQDRGVAEAVAIETGPQPTGPVQASAGQTQAVAAAIRSGADDGPAIASAVRSIGVPKAGLPYLSNLVQNLRQAITDAGHEVDNAVWETLPQRLLSNYRYLVAGDPATSGLMVPLGPVEVLVALDPADPRHVGDPADVTGEQPASSWPGADPTLRVNGTVNSVFATGAHSQTHSGRTSATRGALNASGGIGLAPGVAEVVRVGAGVSGTANQSNRTTTRIADAETGHVEDNRGESVLLAYQPNWSFRVRTAPDQAWSDTAVHRLDDPETERLLLWVPQHYLGSSAQQVTADSVGDRALTLPDTYFASGFSGLPRLFDQIVATLHRQGLDLPVGSVRRDELLQKLWNLDAHLDEAVNDSRGYTFRLHGSDGRTLATVAVHSRRTGDVERIGETSDTAHLENVRTAIDGFSGSHTISNSSTVTALSVSVDLAPAPGIELGVAPSAYLSATWSNTETLSAGRNALWVVVPRYTGQTVAYDAGFEHRATVSVRGQQDTADTPAVPDRALLRLPEPSAFEHGFPVDTDALKEPPEGSDSDGSVPYDPYAIRGTGPREGDPVTKPVPGHVAAGRGVGSGLVRIPQQTVDAIRDALRRELLTQGFLPTASEHPFDGRVWWAHANDLESRLDNEDLLYKLVSRRGLESHYDQIHQDGMTFTLHRRKGIAGMDLDLDSARVTITARKSAQTPPRFVRSTDEYHMVNLAMGMAVSGQSTGGSRTLAAGAKFRLIHQFLRGGAVGGELQRTVGASQFVTYLNNRPELLEFSGTVDEFALTSDYQVTIEYQHSGMQGRMREGARNPEPQVFPNQSALAYLLPLGDSPEQQPASSRSTPPDILDQAAIYYLDTTGVREAATATLSYFSGPAGAGDQELNTFAGAISMRAHLKEILNGAYTSDQLFDPGLLRDTHGAVDIRGRMGTSVFAGATDDPFVLGVIKLWLAQAGTTDQTSSGFAWTQADLTMGGSAGPLSLNGGADATRSWHRGVSESKLQTGGKEYIQLDFNPVYAYTTTVDFTVTGRWEKSGKFAASTTQGDTRIVGDRKMVYLLPEPEALRGYADGILPVPDAKLADALNRWQQGTLKLSGNTVAGILTRWTAEAPLLTSSVTTDRSALAGSLAQLHSSGALPVLDAKTRYQFDEAFGRPLDDPADRVDRPPMPEYLTRKDANGVLLGHSGVHTLTYADGASTFALVREQIDRAAPGLLAAGPELWSSKGQRIGRLQGGVNALQSLLAPGRDQAMLEDLLSTHGHTFYLVNPMGWLLTDIVEVNLASTVDPTPRVRDFSPASGLENYGHAYTSYNTGVSRGGSQALTAARSGMGGDHASGTNTLTVSEGHQRGVTRAEQATTEQTAYDWTGHYRVEFAHTLTVTVRRLDMAGRPLNNVLADWHRQRSKVAGEHTTQAKGTLTLQVPRGLAEARPFVGAANVRSLAPLPALPGDGYITGVLLDDAVPVGRRLLAEMFGSRADDADFRSSLVLPTLLSRSHLTNHLIEATAGRRFKLADHVFLPGHSSDRATLWLTGDLTDLQIIAPVHGTGTGRYSKHQSGTTASSSTDRWRAALGVAAGASGGLGPDTRHSLAGSTSASRGTAAGQGSAGTENYRREQHAKQQGEVYLVRMRARYFLEAERFRHHLFGAPTSQGTHRSAPITGDVYAELFSTDVEQLQAQLAQAHQADTAAKEPWLALSDARSFNLGPLLAEAASHAPDTRRVPAHAARLIRARSEGHPRALILTSAPRTWPQDHANAATSEDPSAPPASLPPHMAATMLDPVRAARDIAHELDAHVRVDLTEADGHEAGKNTVRSRWIDPTGRVYAFDPVTFDDTTLSAQQAQDEQILPPYLRPDVDALGFHPGELGTIYRTSWARQQTFEQALSAEIDLRRARLAAVHPSLPMLLNRAHALADFWGAEHTRLPKGDAATEALGHERTVTRVLDDLRDLARRPDTREQTRSPRQAEADLAAAKLAADAWAPPATAPRETSSDSGPRSTPRPGPGEPRANVIWTEAFDMPGAVRVTLPAIEMSYASDAVAPLRTSTGSLRQAQTDRGEPLGLADDATRMVDYIPAPRLAAHISDLLQADATDVFTTYKLKSATRASSLAASLHLAMSEGGHVIPIGKKTWKDVRITVDLHRRELLAVVEGTSRTTTSTGREAGSASGTGSAITSIVEAGLRTVHIGDARSRSGLTVGVGSPAFRKRGTQTQFTAQSTRVAARDEAEDGRMYRIRVTPQWEVTSTHRSRRQGKEWSSVTTLDDESFIIEVDGRALQQLGLGPVTSTRILQDITEDAREEDALNQSPRPRFDRQLPDPVQRLREESDAFDSAAQHLLSGVYADSGADS